MDHYAEVQITKQGNLESQRKYVLTPTSAPVSVQHISEDESRGIVSDMNLKSAFSKERVLEELQQFADAARHGTWQQFLGIVTSKLKTHLSVLAWAPLVLKNPRNIKADVIAGVTVGVMVIPQSMSYASIAGLPYVYGMYSAFVPTLVYALLGNSRQLAVGPVAMVSLLIEVGLRGLLTAEECPAYWCAGGGVRIGEAPGGPPDCSPPGPGMPSLLETSLDLTQYRLCPDAYARLAILASLGAGLIQLGAGLFNLGFMVSFLGHPVVSGFTSAAAIIIGLSQLKDWLGYDIPKSQFVHVTLYETFSQIEKTNGLNLGLGLSWFLMLYLMRYIATKYPRLSFMRPLGPLITCLLGICMLLIWPVLAEQPYGVKIVGAIPDGLPPWSGTLNMAELTRVLPTATSAALIGFMESIAIGKSLAAKHDYELPAGQELLALGAANFIGSLFSCYPVTGSFSRSAVNNSTGAKTQLSGLITSIIMFLTLLFLTPLFYYLPKFVLAAIVISSVTSLVAWQDALHLWHVKKEDCFLWVFAFIATLFLGVQQGILFSIAASLVIIIHESVRPQISILWRLPGTEIYRNVKQENHGVFVKNVLVVRIGASMYFANVAYIREQLLGHIAAFSRYSPVKYVVVEMTPVISIDSTAIHALEGLLKDLRQRKITLAFATLGNRVEKTMRLAQLYSDIGAEWFHPRVHNAVLHCLRHELQEANGSPMDELLLPPSHRADGADDAEANDGPAAGSDDGLPDRAGPGGVGSPSRNPHEDGVYNVFSAPLRRGSGGTQQQPHPRAPGSVASGGAGPGSASSGPGSPTGMPPPAPLPPAAHGATTAVPPAAAAAEPADDDERWYQPPGGDRV